MDCTITTTRRNHTSGLTLVELLVAAGLSTMVFASMASLMFFSGRSFVALANYVDLDNSSRSALDRMTTDIRQANKLTSYSATNLVFETTDPSTGATGYSWQATSREWCMASTPTMRGRFSGTAELPLAV